MKSSKNRFLLIALALILAFSFLGCGKKDGGDKTEKPAEKWREYAGGEGQEASGAYGEKFDYGMYDDSGKPAGKLTAKNPGSEPEVHYQPGTLHKISVKDTDRPFVTDGRSDYKVIIPADGDANMTEAALFVVGNIHDATGCRLPIEGKEDCGYDAGSRYIVIGRKDLFDKAGLKMPADDLGEFGYYIKTAGNSVFLQANDQYAPSAYQRGAIALLNALVGYRMYWSDTVVYKKDGSVFPDIDIIERPDFNFYMENDVISAKGCYGMGYDRSVMIKVGGWEHHNVFKYFPKDVFLAEHPSFYADNGRQLCHTAHGDEEEYNLMVRLCALKVIECMDNNPGLSNITITQEDNGEICHCRACTAERAKYGKNHAALIIKWMNDVDKRVQQELQRRADREGVKKREFNIIFFAYANNIEPPVKKENGKYVPLAPELMCRENVGVYIAPLHACYTHSIYEGQNEYLAQLIEGWSALSGKLYMWLYETNFHNYFFPLNTYDTMAETYRFCRQNHAVYMFNEGQFNTGAASHFHRLKAYFNSRTYMDVNTNYNELVNDWFENYFGPAAAPMRRFFDELQVHMRYLETDGINVSGGVYDEIAVQENWPKRTLDNWLAMCGDAYKRIEGLKASDPNLYRVYSDHITLETLFPRFALLSLYRGAYPEDDFRARAVSFRDDCNYFNMTRYREGNELSEVLDDWLA